ncbi:MAG: sporulation protein YqfD [[Clostridium] spiroforme]|uniref:Sporulation protein YqfD n=1 Tax=Thomasclavelia spiroformis TaxID=29348 RepID=A0A943EPU6_9FIRM|nr:MULTISPECIES: sporulation protein YqfD [Thomasclavelia]MBS5588993.1 sporulation protein YqfD [Thomasclavelia spiroformis]
MKFGYDLYEVVSNDILSLLKVFKDEHITVFQLNKVDDYTYRFYLPIYQRLLVKKYHLTIIKSVGILYYLLLLFYRKLSVIGVISFVLTILLCNQYIFKVEVIGNNPSTTKLVNEVLNENGIGVGSRKNSYAQLNEIYDDIKKHFKGKIDYLNIYQEGSTLFVKYTNSVSASRVKKNFENIYASKDGIIESIDVSSGNVMVKVNDYVKKGDLLVSNTITSTSDVDKIIETQGVIKAYTYVDYEASIDKGKFDDAEAFSYLLYSIRCNLGVIDKIDRENVLNYGIIENKRVLKMQYVLIEDIASKKEN